MGGPPDLLAASARLQDLVPDAVVVGGSATALHAGHHASLDDDHVIRDLADRFDKVLEALEASEGSLEGVETGIRQLIRRRPLEVETVRVSTGTVRVPTLRETTRVKAWLVLQRNATRDYLDLAALADRLGPDACPVLAGIDEYYADQRGPGGRRIATQLARQLAEPAPYDLSAVDLPRYRGLLPRWQQWPDVVAVCRQVAVGLVAAMGAEEPG